jgi:hypothetical protein
LQEQVDREAIAVTVKASKLTGRVLWAVCRSVGRQIAKAHNAAQTPKGRQSAKKLMNHNVPTSNIPLDGDTKLFDRVARKWNVDYAFRKIDKGKYLLLFKAGQVDDIQGAFAEYSKAYMKRAKDSRAPIAEQVKQAAELVKRQTPKEHTRKREVTRE